MSDESKDPKPLPPVDLVPKRTIHEIIKQDFYDKLKTRPHPNGDDIEFYDPDTNRVFMIMHKYADYAESMTYLFDQIETPYGPVYLTQQSRAKTKGDDFKMSIAYSDKWSDLLCHYIMSGYRIRDIAKMPNMPPLQTIMGWCQRFPELDKKVQAAKEARAEWESDEAWDQSRQMLTDEDSSWQKRSKHVDHLMNFAAKDHPRRFGSKVEVINNSPPTILRLETGVRLDQELPENLRQVKEISGANVTEIIKQLDVLMDEKKDE